MIMDNEYLRKWDEFNNASFYRASNEFWRMMGDVELTPAILEARNNWVADAWERDYAEYNANRLIKNAADRIMSLA